MGDEYFRAGDRCAHLELQTRGGFRDYEAWAAKLHLMGGGINNHDPGETGDRWVRRGDSQAKEE